MIFLQINKSFFGSKLFSGGLNAYHFTTTNCHFFVCIHRNQPQENITIEKWVSLTIRIYSLKLYMLYVSILLVSQYVLFRWLTKRKQYFWVIYFLSVAIDAAKTFNPRQGVRNNWFTDCSRKELKISSYNCIFISQE